MKLPWYLKQAGPVERTKDNKLEIDVQINRLVAFWIYQRWAIWLSFRGFKALINGALGSRRVDGDR